MTAPVLVAGVGNIFFGDDAFGVEVARRMVARPENEALTAIDFGIGGLQLAFELLEPRELVVIADAMPRGGEPGTLYRLEPDEAIEVVGTCPHGMTLPLVFAQVRVMGGILPPIVIVGCEPADTGEGIGLSVPVARAIEPAISLIEQLVASHRSTRTPEKLAQ